MALASNDLPSFARSVSPTACLSSDCTLFSEVNDESTLDEALKSPGNRVSGAPERSSIGAAGLIRSGGASEPGFPPSKSRGRSKTSLTVEVADWIECLILSRVSSIKPGFPESAPAWGGSDGFENFCPTGGGRSELTTGRPPACGSRPCQAGFLDQSLSAAEVSELESGSRGAPARAPGEAASNLSARNSGF